MWKMSHNNSYPIIVGFIMGTIFGFFLSNMGEISKTYAHNAVQKQKVVYQKNLTTNVDKTKDKAFPITCINSVKTDCDPHLRNWFHALLKRKAPSHDAELIEFARALIDPPSTHPLRKLPWGLRSTPQAEFIDKLLNEKVFR